MNEGSRSALVTGASAGIGFAFAHVLAQEGYGLVLTARREDRLHVLAKELTDRYGVRTLVVPANLEHADAPARLVESIAAAGWTVDVLINNAGYGVPGSYASTSWDQQRAFLQVLVVALAELAHRLVPPMMDRRWGRIINVASLAGLLPGVAGHTLYAGAKAFVIRFSESLALEVERHGVQVTASCPGFTLSEFHDVTGTRDKVSRMPKFMWLTADEVARGSYEAVMAGRPVYIPGRFNRSMALLSRQLPQGVVMALMKRMSGSYRKT